MKEKINKNIEEMEEIEFELTAEEYEHYSEKARKAGYEDLCEFVRALALQDLDQKK